MSNLVQAVAGRRRVHRLVQGVAVVCERGEACKASFGVGMYILARTRRRNSIAEKNSAKAATDVCSLLELCADKLVVGGGVGWSYDRRRRRRRPRQTG